MGQRDVPAPVSAARMVDWELVERRRSKGWGWDRIAEDPKVGFHADDTAGDPGRALRALYYQRKSKTKRRSSSSGADGSKVDGEPGSGWSLERVAAIVAPLLVVWFVIAFFIPSPVGTYLPAIPDLVIVMLLAVGLLAFALLRSAERWTPAIRNGVVAGVVLGVVFAGAFGVAALVSGCPTLTSQTTGEPGSFSKANNALWADSGAPVFFFYGSAACPYCSASSWAMVVALEQFGTLSGVYQDHSSPTDVYPNTPELVLSNAALQSKWVSMHIAESTSDTTITPAATTGCVESAYVSTYDNVGSIPYVVIGGQYLHVGAMVNPASLQGMSATQVQSQVSNQSGAAWNAISPTAYLLEAFIVKANGGQPASVATNPSVAPLLAQIH
jgi:hypothetical protein